MAAAVFSATITTIIAFWSLTLIGGRFGELIAGYSFYCDCGSCRITGGMFYHFAKPYEPFTEPFIQFEMV